MGSNPGQHRTRSLFDQSRLTALSPPLLPSQGKAALSTWKPKPYRSQGINGFRPLRFQFGSPSDPEPEPAPSPPPDPDPQPAPPPAPPSPPLSNPSRPTSPSDGPDLNLDRDDLDPFEHQYVGSECPDCGAIILREMAPSITTTTTTETEDPLFLAGDDSGIVAAHGEAAAGYSYGLGESVEDSHSSFRYPFIGDATSFVPAQEELYEPDAIATAATATIPAAANDTPASSLNSDPEHKTAQEPENRLPSPKDDSNPGLAGEEPSEIVQRTEEIPSNHRVHDEMQPQAITISHDKDQRQCQQCQRWQPSSQFHDRRPGRRVHDQQHFTTSCLRCRRDPDSHKPNLPKEKSGDAALSDFIVCPTCRNFRPRSDFETSDIAAHPAAVTDAPASSTGDDDDFVKSCRACQVKMGDKTKCARCTKLLPKSVRVRILADGGRRLCSVCLSSSSGEEPRLGLLSPPPSSPPKAARATAGVVGRSGYGNADENTVTAPSAPAEATSIETDSGSSQRKRQCPLSPTKSPNMTKRTKFASTGGETMGYEAGAIVNTVTEANYELMRYTGNGEATSKLTRPSPAVAVAEARTTVTPSTHAATATPEEWEATLTSSKATPGTAKEALSAHVKAWRIPHEAWMPVSQLEFYEYRHCFLSPSNTASQPYSQSVGMCPTPEEVAARQRGIIVYVKLVIPGLQTFLDDLESCRQLCQGLGIPVDDDEADETNSSRQNSGAAAAFAPSALRALWFVERLMEEHHHFALLVRDPGLSERFFQGLIQHIVHLESQEGDSKKEKRRNEEELDNKVGRPELGGRDAKEGKKIIDHLQWRFG